MKYKFNINSNSNINRRGGLAGAVLTLTLLFVFVLISPAFAGITTTNLIRQSLGNKKGVEVTAAFDSSYAWGGESLTAASVGLNVIEKAIITGVDGYNFEYDYTNGKVKVLTSAPAMVYDEKISVTAAAAGTLSYPVAWIFNVTDSAGNPISWKYSGTTTFGTTNQFALTAEITKGARSSVTADAVDDYYVTYATQAWEDIYSLLVQNSGVSLPVTASKTNAYVSGASVWGIGYIVDYAGTTVYTVTDYETAAASLTASQIGVDWNASTSGDSTYLSHALTQGVGVYVTYLKKPPAGAWLANNTITGVTLAGTAGTSTYTATLDGGASGVSKPWLVPTSTGVLPVRSAEPLKLVRQSSAVSGARTVKWGYTHNTPVTISAAAGGTFVMYGQLFGDASASGATPTNVQIIAGYPWEIPNVKQLEVPNARDLSNLTGVKIELIGY